MLLSLGQLSFSHLEKDGSPDERGSEIELIQPHSVLFAGISLLDTPALMNHLSCSALIHEVRRRDVLNGL